MRKKLFRIAIIVIGVLLLFYLLSGIIADKIFDKTLNRCYDFSSYSNTTYENVAIKLETILLDNNILENNSQSGYVDLVKDILDKRNAQKYVTFYEQYKSYDLLNHAPFNHCYDNCVLETYNKTKSIFLRSSSIEKMNESYLSFHRQGDWGNMKLNEQLISCIEEKKFNKIEYRLSAISLVYFLMRNTAV